MDFAPPGHFSLLVNANARDRFFALLHTAVLNQTLTKLTLGRHRGPDTTLENLSARFVTLQAGTRLSLVWRHSTNDLTKNFPPADALALLEPLIGRDFLDAHLFTPGQIAQFTGQPDGTARLRVKTVTRAGADSSPAPGPAAHDQPKAHLVPANAPWLRALGVTNDHGQPRAGMADKFRQIQKFSELLAHLVVEAGFTPDEPLRVTDMASGKGYLTFAAAAQFGPRATVQGIEQRPGLVALCNRVANEGNFPHLSFTAGQIAASTIVSSTDVLLALHACDTATDDALAHGIAAGARLLVVAPCCHQELRPQLTAPPALAGAFRHGIFLERQAEFVTDVLRAQLLEWAGYRVKAFEFISSEHTAKNLMLAAVRSHPPGDAARAADVRSLAACYGVRTQHLAVRLNFPLQQA